jgi:ribosomal protein S18 acetylase RimI-like enzyme
MDIREMDISDYEACRDLWSAAPGVRLTDADGREAVEAFLLRNPGMSFVCTEEDKLIGTAMCGHDGRRGYIYHVAVKPEYRGKRVGTGLVEACTARLRAEGIGKCHVFVVADNALGRSFWASFFKGRNDIVVYSKDI